MKYAHFTISCRTHKVPSELGPACTRRHLISISSKRGNTFIKQKVHPPFITRGIVINFGHFCFLPFPNEIPIGDFVHLQDGLRRRMDKLKSSIEEANQAVDKEREKNVSLLHLIFPPDIAKRLWLGKLFSDSQSSFLVYCLLFCAYIFINSIQNSQLPLIPGGHFTH